MAKTSNPWFEHVKKYKQNNPKLSHKEALEKARPSYSPIGGKKKNNSNNNNNNSNSNNNYNSNSNNNDNNNNNSNSNGNNKDKGKTVSRIVKDKNNKIDSDISKILNSQLRAEHMHKTILKELKSISNKLNKKNK